MSNYASTLYIYPIIFLFKCFPYTASIDFLYNLSKVVCTDTSLLQSVEYFDNVKTLVCISDLTFIVCGPCVYFVLSTDKNSNHK